MASGASAGLEAPLPPQQTGWAPWLPALGWRYSEGGSVPPTLSDGGPTTLTPRAGSGSLNTCWQLTAAPRWLPPPRSPCSCSWSRSRRARPEGGVAQRWGGACAEATGSPACRRGGDTTSGAGHTAPQPPHEGRWRHCQRLTANRAQAQGTEAEGLPRNGGVGRNGPSRKGQDVETAWTLDSVLPLTHLSSSHCPGPHELEES